MEVLFARTIEGREESARPGLSLGAPSRQLLCCLDRALGADAWISTIKGAQLGDAVPLIAHELVRVTRSSIDAEHGCAEQRLLETIRAMSSEALYDLLTGQAKLRLGLMRGFRLILALERSNTREARQHLAIWLTLDLCRRQDVDGLRVMVERVLGRTKDEWAEVVADDPCVAPGPKRALKLR